MKVFGAHDERTREQLEDVDSRTVRVALMADDAPVEHPLFDSAAWEGAGQQHHPRPAHAETSGRGHGVAGKVVRPLGEPG